MIHHPLILRELQVEARRRSGFWTRILVSAGAVLFGLVWLLQFQWIGRSAADGAPLYGVLAVVSWTFALVSGPLMTADAISSERREGTLGLLHLSRISPWEIVLSKFVSAATRLAPLLLGVVPVMVLCLLMGGLTLGEILRGALSIALTAGVSLAAGLLGSAASWHGGFTTASTLAFLAVWNLLPVVFRFAVPALSNPLASTLPDWIAVSPWACLAAGRDAAFSAAPSRFWQLGAGMLGLNVLFLAAAAFRMRRAGFPTAPAGVAPASSTGPAGKGRRRLAFPDDRDPLGVLLSLSSGQRLTIWAPAILCVGIDSLAVSSGTPVEIFSAATGIFCAAIHVAMIWHRVAALRGLRSSQLIELLMVLPTPARENQPPESPVLFALRTSVNRPAAFALGTVVGYPILAGLVVVLLKGGEKGLSVPLLALYTAVAQILRYMAGDAVSTRLALRSQSASRAFFGTVGLTVLAPLVLPCFLDWGLLIGLLFWAGTGDAQRRWLQEAVAPPPASGPQAAPHRPIPTPPPLPPPVPPAETQPGAGQ